MLEREVIKQLALEAGFDACGVAPAGALHEDVEYLKVWLAAGNHGSMGYLERNFEKRTDVRKLVEGSQTVVVGLLNHYTDYEQPEGEKRIAKFRLSKVDYHKVVRRYLNKLESAVTERYGHETVNTEQQHSFCDTAPILERRWAERAGLGWIGRNKLLIHPTLGSYTNIGILVLNAQCDKYNTPLQNRCGTCHICEENCPTKALQKDKMYDARACLSYWTTATKEPIPAKYTKAAEQVLVGCDACTNYCPWNANLTAHNNPDLTIDTTKYFEK